MSENIATSTALGIGIAAQHSAFNKKGIKFQVDIPRDPNIYEDDIDVNIYVRGGELYDVPLDTLISYICRANNLFYQVQTDSVKVWREYNGEKPKS